MLASRIMMGRAGTLRNNQNSAKSRQSQGRFVSSSTVRTTAEEREQNEMDHVVISRILAMLPTLLMCLGALLLVVGVPVLICGYVPSLNYTAGQGNGIALIVFGVIFAVIGFVWMKVSQNRAKKLVKESRDNQVRDSHGQMPNSRQMSIAANSNTSVGRPQSRTEQGSVGSVQDKTKLNKNSTENIPDVGTGLPNDGYEVDLSDVDEKREAEKAKNNVGQRNSDTDVEKA